MEIKKDDVAKLLGISISTINRECKNVSASEITFDEYQRIVDINGGDDPISLYEKGASIFYDGTKRYVLAIPLFIKSAKQDNANAINSLAQAYLYGYGVEKNVDMGVEYLNKGIRKNNAFALYIAGKMFDDGINFPKDIEKSIYYMKLSADLGLHISELYLGKMYLRKGASYNPDMAEKYLLKAYEGGEIKAAKELGFFYYDCEGYIDYTKSIQYLRVAADNKDADSFTQLGVIYYNGIGVEKDFVVAFDFFTKGADLGQNYALNYLGDFYKKGIVVKQNIQEAIKYFSLAAESGNIDACISLHNIYYYGEGVSIDYEKAFKAICKLAKFELPDVLNEIGYMYYSGKGVERNYAKAYEYYKKSADLGESIAIHNLGVLYRDGLYVKQNTEEAIRLFKSAAEKGYVKSFYQLGAIYWNKGDYYNAHSSFVKSREAGDPKGMVGLGILYENGDYVKKDYNEAFRLFHEAALNDYNEAFYRLGVIYEHGLGVKRNKNKAKELYSAAVLKGYKDAEDNLKKLGVSILYDSLKNAAEGILKDEVKDLLADIISDAFDKILDEDGSVISDLVGEAIAQGIMNAFDS